VVVLLVEAAVVVGQVLREHLGNLQEMVELE
jgi:hypothetical protein